MKKVINLLLIIIIIFSSYKIIEKIIDYNESEKINNALEEIKVKNNNYYDELKKINSNYKFWLEVEGTNINYPVVQGKDNTYYLDHNFYNKKNSSGTLFVNYKNDIKKDKNIIIFGHNMKNKSMFQNLMKFKNKDFFNKNKIINIYENGKKEKYEIFSAYIVDDDFDYLKWKFNSKDEYKKYLNECKEKSLFKRNINLNENDKIITLSTCSYETKEARMVVQCKKI